MVGISFYRGKLMKGSKDKIIQVIDQIEERVSVIKIVGYLCN